MTSKKFPNGRDPSSGLMIKADGTLHGHTGQGKNRKYTPIPPADMAELVKNGLAPELIPNWDPADPNSNWQCGYRKFTPERREIFLQKLEQTGRVRLACRFAGISHTTVFRHKEADPQFAEACEEAEAMYHENVVASITHQARVGMTDERYDKDGRLICRRVTYETQLRKMMVQRADSSYNDTSRQELAVTGGAVVVPAPTDSVESWDDVVRRHTGQAVSANLPANVGALALPEAGGTEVMAGGAGGPGDGVEVIPVVDMSAQADE